MTDLPPRKSYRARPERGSVIPEFVLILLVLIPLVATMIHIALVVHVRNTLTTAASDGARAGAARGANDQLAVDRTRALISRAVSDRFAQEVTAKRVVTNGLPTIQVTVRAHVPALGLVGPGTSVSATAHSILQDHP